MAKNTVKAIEFVMHSIYPVTLAIQNLFFILLEWRTIFILIFKTNRH